MPTDNDSTDNLSARLNAESGVIEWSDLVKHFARGVVISVSPGLDLIDVARHIAEDQTEQVGAWLENDLIRRASDDDARDWTRREPSFWCVVTAPWVLVQEKTDARPEAVH